MRSDQLHKLREDGVVAIDRYLDEVTFRSLLSAVEADARDDADAAVRVKRGVPFARRNVLSAPWCRAFVGSPAVRSVVDAVAPGSAAVRAILFDKTGDANWTVPWHQDRSIAVRERRDVEGFGPWSVKAGVVHVQPPADVLRAMVTLRFSLDPCDADNGPLRTIAGTHGEILDAAAVDAAVRRGPEVTCTTAAGGLVVMRPLAVHASSPAKRPGGHRRVLHVEFGPPALAGGLEWAVA